VGLHPAVNRRRAAIAVVPQVHPGIQYGGAAWYARDVELASPARALGRPGMIVRRLLPPLGLPTASVVPEPFGELTSSRSCPCLASGCRRWLPVIPSGQ
jgi:hypothetical protein